MNMCKRGLALTLCFLETTILGGALFGWPSLVYVLQADELYIDKCRQTPDTAMFPLINVSSPPTILLDINAVRSNSLGAVIDLSRIKNSSTTKVSADSFDTTGSVTTANVFSVNTNVVDSSANADNNADSDTDGNDTVTAKAAIRCEEQKVALSLSYTVATVSFGIGALPIGLLFDRFGLRTTRTIAAFLGVAGYCQLAFAKRGMEWTILTGAVFIGLSCYTVLLTNFHVAKLAGKRICLATAIYAAGMSASFAYQLVKMAHDAGLTRVVGLLTLASFWLVVLFTSWYLLPKDKIDNGIRKHSMFPLFVITWGDITMTKGKVAPNIGGGPAKQERSLCGYITSATFIAFLFWFCADFVRNNMMINAYDSWITQIVHGDLRKVTFYIDFLAYGTLSGSLLTPLMGLITDFMRGRYGHEPGGKALTLLPTALFSSLFMALVNVPLLFHTEAAIFAAGVLFLIAKPLFLSTPALFMSIMPPMQYYGVVFGIMNVAGGVSSFMVHPYLMWAAAVHSFTPVNLMILVSNILAFSFPLMLIYDRWAELRRKEKSRQQNTETQQNNTMDGVYIVSVC